MLKRACAVIDLRLNIYLHLHKLLLIRQIKPPTVWPENESKDKAKWEICAVFVLLM